MTDDWERHCQEYDDLVRFAEESGTPEEFIEWVEGHRLWLSPHVGNTWLIRRDSLRKAAFGVLWRANGREWIEYPRPAEAQENG